jgi:hypothetical protein
MADISICPYCNYSADERIRYLRSNGGSMSIFNKPYKSDDQLKKEQKEKKRKERYDQRKLQLRDADLIYKFVVDGIEQGGKHEWTKREMIDGVRGSGKMDLASKIVWNKSCDIAIGKIRRRYWNVTNGNELARRMFNYHRRRGIYKLVSVDDRLATSEICEEYYEKMRALKKKDKELKESVYKDIAKLEPIERKKLIQRLLAEEGE